MTRSSGAHGKGTFFDPRLDDANQFPIAAENHFGHVQNETDLITSKLPALHLYQMSLPTPVPPQGSFDEEAAKRGDALFSGKAKCSTCHTEPMEPAVSEVSKGSFEIDREVFDG